MAPSYHRGEFATVHIAGSIAVAGILMSSLIPRAKWVSGGVWAGLAYSKISTERVHDMSHRDHPVSDYQAALGHDGQLVEGVSQ